LPNCLNSSWPTADSYLGSENRSAQIFRSVMLFHKTWNTHPLASRALKLLLEFVRVTLKNYNRETRSDLAYRIHEMSLKDAGLSLFLTFSHFQLVS